MPVAVAKARNAGVAKGAMAFQNGHGKSGDGAPGGWVKSAVSVKTMFFWFLFSRFWMTSRWVYRQRVGLGRSGYI